MLLRARRSVGKPEVSSLSDGPNEECNEGGEGCDQAHNQGPLLLRQEGCRRHGRPVGAAGELLSQPLRKLRRLACPSLDSHAALVMNHRWVVVDELLVAKHLVHGAVHRGEADDVAKDAASVQGLVVLLRKAQVCAKQLLARLVPVNTEEHHPVVDPVSCEHVSAKGPAVQWYHRLETGADDRLLPGRGQRARKQGRGDDEPRRGSGRHDEYEGRTEGERRCVRPE
mmetsp:Transcript_61767/g.184004  ORF Transcript_61767/g.184004 Transcript_61767/m.184004 type:complete len:226 (+) Transcript_61767:221-898(+)